MTKIAFATDDLIKISPHLGRAKKYLIYTIQNGKVIAQEERVKPVHDHGKQEGHEHHGGQIHNDMVQVIADCQIVVARGMGKPAFESVKKAELHTFLTELSTIEEALQAYLEGRLEHCPERIHS
jgi:predicted Fe-Mo cluster-binding NifX family protein